MSVYIQEVLGLLKRNKRKKKLDKVKDHFEFGKLYQTSNLNTGAAYNPKMEPFVVRWGDLVCEATEDLTRTQPGSGNLGFVPVYTTPEGSCSWDTLKDSIITQNAIGDTITINNGNLIVEGDLQVDQNANVNLQLTAGSANILDLTEDRIVIVGPNGELEDDPNFTMDGITFTALVNVQHGVPVVSPAQPTTNTVLNSNIFLNGPVYDSQGNVGGLAQVLVGLADGRVIWSDDDVVEALTYGSLWQGNINDLKQELPIGTADQILISDGVTFSWEDNPAAIVGEQCAVYTIPLWTPDSNTLGCSKLVQDGDNSTPATNITSSVTFNVQNTSTDSIINLVNDDNNQVNFFTPGNNVYGIEAEANGSDTLVKIEHFTSEDANLTKEEFISLDLDTTQTNNKLVLAGDAAGSVHPRLADGSVQVNVDLELEDVPDDNALEKVLVRDTTTGLVRQRDASTIKPQVGFDTLDMLPDGWASTDGNFNAYVNLDDTTTPVKNIKDMDWLVDGDRVVVIAENTKTGSLLADNVIRFPQWSSTSFTTVSNHTSWNQASIGSGWTGAIDNGYETSTLLYGEKIKFKAELYEVPATGTAQLNWDACCKIYSDNTCPIVNNASFTVDEDVSHNGTLITSDDGYGGYGYTFTIVSQPTNGTITNFDSATGTYTYTPDPNYNGYDSFTYQANDGYCDSNVANVNITVNSINDAPIWTSIDPTDPTYTGTPWTNLTGGDVLVPYNWTVADPDHPCSDLTYNMTLVDSNGTPGTWLTFTPNTPADCGGTLSGTYPVTGGIWTVILTVTDPGGLSATQEFTISGIIPDKDTYFAVWIDNSGSMSTLAQQLSRQVSVGQAILEVTGIGANSITGTGGTTGGTQVNDSVFINDISALVAGTVGVGQNSNFLVPSTLPAGVTTSFSIQIIDPTNGNLTNTGINITTQQNPNSVTLLCDANPTGTIQVGDYLLLTISDALASNDYNNPDSLRSLFQDFYATGGVEGAPDFNTDPATNGRNRYTSHLKFGFMNEAPGNGENWFYGLANYGYQDTQTEFDNTVSTGGIFEDATTICTLVFGDEASGSYDTINTSAPYNGTGTVGGGNLLNDLNSVRTWITLGPNASINGTPTNVNAVGCMFAANTGSSIRNIGISAGARDGVGFGDTAAGQTFGGNWSNTTTATLLPIEPTPPTPRRMEFSGYNGDPTFTIGGVANGIPQSSPSAGFYQNLIRTKLQDLGFQNI